MSETILKVRGLAASYEVKGVERPLLQQIDLTIPRGQVVGVVGESGSGKSLTMKSLLGILPDNITASFERFEFAGQPVADLRQLPIAMIFQDPMTSLNPLRTIGYHLVEVIRRQQKMSRKAARALAQATLEQVGIPLAATRLKQYPHELSGGMRQRVMIAMALLAQPQLLIADEPTTALDVTIQAQILSLIKQLQQAQDLSVILVTHDFGVVAGMCDFVKVMYQGRVVEEGTVNEIFETPTHPYTQQLLQAAQLGETPAVSLPPVPVMTVTTELFCQELTPTHRVWRAKEDSDGRID